MFARVVVQIEENCFLVSFIFLCHSEESCHSRTTMLALRCFLVLSMLSCKRISSKVILFSSLLGSERVPTRLYFSLLDSFVFFLAASAAPAVHERNTRYGEEDISGG